MNAVSQSIMCEGSIHYVELEKNYFQGKSKLALMVLNAQIKWQVAEGYCSSKDTGERAAKCSQLTVTQSCQWDSQNMPPDQQMPSGMFT